MTSHPAASPSPDDSKKENESVVLNLGYRKSYDFVIVPRVEIQFDPPPESVTKDLSDPRHLIIPFPVTGTALHLPPGDRKAELTWIVERTEGGKPVQNMRSFEAVMKVGGGGKFKIEVAGKEAALDILDCQMVGNGTVRVRLTPDFPHVVPARSTPISYKAALSLSPSKTGAGLLGELISFAPKHADVFAGAELELRILDEQQPRAGGGESAFCNTWLAGGSRKARSWSVGFTDTDNSLLAVIEDGDDNQWSFTWQLWGADRAGGTKRLLLEGPDFLKVKLPRLVVFNLEYDPSIWATWSLHGEISDLHPSADLGVTLGVVEIQPSGAEIVEKIEVKVDDAGKFRARMGRKHLFTPVDGDRAPKAYAILGLPAARTGLGSSPIARYLAFDDTVFSLFHEKDVTWDDRAEFVTSAEALAFRSRGERPKKKARPQKPPIPANDGVAQDAVLTFDDIYKDLVGWEAEVPYMYRDNSKDGWITVGVGNKLESRAAALGLAFVNRSGGHPATDEEKGKAYDVVQKMASGRPYFEYEKFPNIELEPDVILALCKKRVETDFLPGLQKIFGGADGFGRLPRSARRALLDIAYNTGTGNMAGWKMTAAIKAGDWATAAKNVPTGGRAERRAWRAELFELAAPRPR